MKSIKEIAIEAGVSIGTVDRVIHNRTGVSKRTKEKIQKIIKENNYTVNPVASILASKKNYTIATLLPKTNTLKDFWATPKKGIEQAMDEIKNLGFLVNHFEFDQFSSASYINTFKNLVDSHPNAVLLAPTFNKETKELIHLLDDQNIPYVFINTGTEGLNNLSFIGQDSYKSGFLAGKLMNWVLPQNAEIAVIEIRKNVTNYTSIHNRIKGFVDYFKTSKKSISINHLHIDQLENEFALETQLKTYLEKNNNIKGIFVPSSKISTIAKAIENLKKTDIEMGGFDTTTDNVKYLKKGTVDFLISQKPTQQGYDGIKFLYNHLTHQNQPKKNSFSPIEIVLKENVDFLQ